MQMKSLSGVGVGLSLVFGCLFLALVAELYYLLWWKKKRVLTNKRFNHHDDENGTQIPPQTPHFCYIFCCCRNPNSPTPQELCSSPTLVHHPQPNKNLWPKPFSEDQDSIFPDLPRFLFTITEETMEDLESEDISRRNLNDLLQVLETPFLTPLASPAASSHDHYFTPPLTPSFHHKSSFDSEELKRVMMMMRASSSPPPRLKFLRDAEEKLMMMRSSSSPPPKMKFLRDAEEKLMMMRSQTRIIMQENGNMNCNLEKLECSPQVLPLVSSPQEQHCKNKNSIVNLQIKESLYNPS
ncbi:hypothetical protein Salat_1717200 [Sesamum alatum]|uniref:Uncharacterized protein n=1 Tax=Sesamum alatum TaxID=300844 RepID=A0AAE1Y8X7_9LAMI|nr:hypothetical protein Salat_1717200 [Sesamum alatum]